MNHRFLSLAAALVLVSLLFGGCQKSASPPAVSAFPPASSTPAEISSSEEPASAPPQSAYPVGKMFVTEERLAYQDGALVLRVPRLNNLETKVVGGFSPEIQEQLQNGTMSKEERRAFFGNSEGDLLLKTGVVLLNSSCLPVTEVQNPNVSISGHRDIEGSEFYDIHKLTKGDLIYLTYGGKEYTYAYHSTTIHESNDWSITYCQSDSMISLISCDPIGTSRNRIVAVGTLVEVKDIAAGLPG